MKLNRIYNQLLKKHDPELYHRLQLLDIPPQIYGLYVVMFFFSSFVSPLTLVSL